MAFLIASSKSRIKQHLKGGRNIPHICIKDKDYTLPGRQTLFKTGLFAFILVFDTYVVGGIGDKYEAWVQIEPHKNLERPLKKSNISYFIPMRNKKSHFSFSSSSSLPPHADTVVVGGGIVGVSTAFHLKSIYVCELSYQLGEHGLPPRSTGPRRLAPRENRTHRRVKLVEASFAKQINKQTNKQTIKERNN